LILAFLESRSRSASGAALAVGLALLVAATCSNHGAGFVLRTRGDSTSDVEKALAAVEAVGDDFHLRRETDSRTDAPVQLPDESRVLLEFQSTPARGKADEGERSRIVLAVAASRDGTQLRFLLQDLDRGNESAYFRRVQSALEAALAQAYPGRPLERQGGRVATGVSTR
jgi:hypothetical protein